jgi:hypothetical protein
MLLAVYTYSRCMLPNTVCDCTCEVQTAGRSARWPVAFQAEQFCWTECVVEKGPPNECLYCGAEGAILLFAVKQFLKMSVLNVWCLQVVSGINLFIHPLKNVVPSEVVLSPMMAPPFRAFCEVCCLNLSKFAPQCCSAHSDIKSLVPFNTVLSFGKARSLVGRDGVEWQSFCV